MIPHNLPGLLTGPPRRLARPAPMMSVPSAGLGWHSSQPRV